MFSMLQTIDFAQELRIRIADPRIFLNEFFGYMSFTAGLVTAFLFIFNFSFPYTVSNQILLLSCALQNLPLLMVYILNIECC